MRISDWSSDVCSSDLAGKECRGICPRGEGVTARNMMRSLFGIALLAATPAHAHEGHADGAAEPHGGARVTIVTSDVDRFYALYDDPALAAQPELVAARHLAAPTPGLAEFIDRKSTRLNSSH